MVNDRLDNICIMDKDDLGDENDRTIVGGFMRKYLFSGSYTPEGFKGLVKDGGSSRIEAAKRSLESMGGSLEAFYFALGEKDFYIIVNLPDDVTAASVTMAGNMSGTFSIKSTVLLTAKEMDAVVKRHPDFRPPGQ